jgi:ABC-type multidrug transport system ATPase subunit
MKTTLLFVTHAISRLSYSDHVIVLDQRGYIAEQGSFSKLGRSGSYIQNLKKLVKDEDNSSTEEPYEVSTTGNQNIGLLEANNEVEALTEELSRQTGDLGVYKYYFSSVGWWYTSIFIGCATLYGTAIKFTEFLLIYCKLSSKAFTTCLITPL